MLFNTSVTKLERIIDRSVGFVLCKILSWFPQSKRTMVPQNLLVIKLWAVGESILTLPLIRELRRRFPAARIDVLVRRRNKEVYTNNPDISSVVLLEEVRTVFRRLRSYDLVFDCEPYLNISALLARWLGRETVGFSHGVRGDLYLYKVDYNDRQHVVLTYLDLLRPFFNNIPPPRTLVPLRYTLDDKQAVDQFLRTHGVTHHEVLIGFCAGSAESAPSRRWAEENFATVADTLLKRRGTKIVLVGGPDEQSLNNSLKNRISKNDHVINAAGQTTLKQSFALIERCALFISNDTGPMHVAAAQGVPTVGLFGPNTPVRFAPYGRDHVSLYKPTLPQPCIHVHLGQIPNCVGHDHFSNILVRDVMRATEKLLKNFRRKKEGAARLFQSY